MLKKAQVVMLTTEKESRLSQNSTGKLHYENDSYGHSPNFTPKHLYFVTDDEIKEGDWYIAIDIKSLIKCTKITGYIHGGSIQSPKNLAKKVIATTNPDLWFRPLEMEKWDYPFKIPTDFIEAYVREQGKITEVNLEIEIDQFIKTGQCMAGAVEGYYTYKPKLRPNDTVIVHPVKEKMFTEKQIRKALDNPLGAGSVHRDKYRMRVLTELGLE